MLETKDKIIFALVRKKGQTFTELLKTARTNRDSLSRGLTALKKENLIKNEDGLYFFSSDMKNQVLLSLKGSYEIAIEFEDFLQKIKIAKLDPFPSSLEMIHRIFALHTILKLERYSSLKLTKRDKMEFDLYNDLFDSEIELIFDTLRKRNPRKTKELKSTLFKKLFPSKV